MNVSAHTRSAARPRCQDERDTTLVEPAGEVVFAADGFRECADKGAGDLGGAPDGARQCEGLGDVDEGGPHLLRQLHGADEPGQQPAAAPEFTWGLAGVVVVRTGPPRNSTAGPFQCCRAVPKRRQRSVASRGRRNIRACTVKRDPSNSARPAARRSFSRLSIVSLCSAYARSGMSISKISSVSLS